MRKVFMKKVHGSSNIDAVGYMKERNDLFVRFNSGRVYAYAQVPYDLYESLILAPSKGVFFNARIKKAFTWKEVVASGGDVVLVDEDDGPLLQKPKLEPMAEPRWSW